MPTKQKFSHLQRIPAHNQRSSHQGETEEVSQIYPATVSELRRAVINPRSASPGAILGLQSRYGNQAVQRLVAKSSGLEVQRGFMGDFKQNLAKTLSKDKKRGKIAGFNEEDQIKYLIADLSGNRLFRTYCANEFSIENLDSYEFIGNYAKAGRPLPMAQKFDERFLLRTSEQEINIPAEVLKTYKKLLAEGNPGDYLVKNVAEAIMTNLLDTFSRFRITKAFQQWGNSKVGVSSAI